MSKLKLDQPDVASAPNEFDALFAAAAMPSVGGAVCASIGVGKHHPTRSLPDLARATLAISRWYERELGEPSKSPIFSEEVAFNLDSIVKQHVAIRKEWERREAVGIAAWLTETISHAPRVKAPVPAPVINSVVKDTRRRALLIDDSSDILVTVGAFLEAFGFAVTLAESGEAALQILMQTPMDLLVTDHAMPGMTGKDLATEAMLHNSELRVIIITGYPDLRELKELPPSAMLLAKPFRRAELFGKLRTLFDRHDTNDVTKAFAGEYCVSRD